MSLLLLNSRRTLTVIFHRTEVHLSSSGLYCVSTYWFYYSLSYIVFILLISALKESGPFMSYVPAAPRPGGDMMVFIPRVRKTIEMTEWSERCGGSSAVMGRWLLYVQHVNYDLSHTTAPPCGIKSNSISVVYTVTEDILVNLGFLSQLSHEY